MAPNAEGYVKVNDLELYYQTLGDRGEPLLMIMGLSFSHLDWGPALPQLLSQHYHVILLDNRDSGQSSDAFKPYTMARMVDDVAELLEVLNIDSAHIFGISMGGMIAQQFALNYSNKLNKLILGCTTCNGKVLQRADQALASKSLLDLLFTPTYIRDHCQELEDFLESTRPYHSKPDGFLRQFGAIATHDVCSQLTHITTPTLIMTGDSDVLIPPDNSKILEQGLPNAKLLPAFLDAVHGFPYSYAQETADAVQQFLG